MSRTSRIRPRTPSASSFPPVKLRKADYEKLANFRYQLRIFLRFSEEVTRKKGITVLQYQLMLQIKGFPGREWATMGELTERLQAKQHGVVSLVSRCEAAGLVSRSASEIDKRRVEVRLTKNGSRCLEELASLHRAELLALQGKGGVSGLNVFPFAKITGNS